MAAAAPGSAHANLESSPGVPRLAGARRSMARSAAGAGGAAGRDPTATAAIPSSSDSAAGTRRPAPSRRTCDTSTRRRKSVGTGSTSISSARHGRQAESRSRAVSSSTSGRTCKPSSGYAIRNGPPAGKRLCSPHLIRSSASFPAAWSRGRSLTRPADGWPARRMVRPRQAAATRLLCRRPGASAPQRRRRELVDLGCGVFLMLPFLRAVRKAPATRYSPPGERFSSWRSELTATIGAPGLAQRRAPRRRRPAVGDCRPPEGARLARSAASRP